MPTFLTALEGVQRRFRISQSMIFTGLKATIPHDCKPSWLEQTPAPILSESSQCILNGKIKSRRTDARGSPTYTVPT